MTLNLLYFSWVREALGRDGETVEPPATVKTVAELLRWLDARDGGSTVFGDTGKLRVALDQAFAPFSASLAGVGEVAIFPPVTGG